MKQLFFLIIATTLIIGCSTAKKAIPENAIILTGKMNPVMGGKVLSTQSCWAMEVGKDLRSLKYYQFIGDINLLQQLFEEDVQATVKAVLRPEVKSNCEVGMVAEVYEIVELRTKRD